MYSQVGERKHDPVVHLTYMIERVVFSFTHLTPYSVGRQQHSIANPITAFGAQLIGSAVMDCVL